jgi:aspartate/methionine/tyrosine aminotransferase
MIIVNNPNNPTGATTPRSVLEAIVEFAKARSIIVFADEVYNPLYHSLPAGEQMPPSVLSLGYEKTISTGSMSKAFALAGIRLGWVTSRDASIVTAIAAARDYTTISVSQLDDQVASYALSDSVQPALLRRNTALACHNLALLEAFVRKYESVCSWTKPTGGTTALLKFKTRGGESVDDEKFMLDVLDKTKVLFLPGGPCFGKEFKGFVRIGYVCHTDVLEEALQRLGGYVEQHLL